MTAKLGDGDGCSNGDIEALTSSVGSGKRGNGEPMGHFAFDGGADAVALIAHDDDCPIGGEVASVDVVAREKGPIDRHSESFHYSDERANLHVVNANASDGSHGGLHSLGRIAVCRAGRADDLPDAKPVTESDDGADIARILHIVQGERERRAQPIGVKCVCGSVKCGDDLLRCGQQTYALHLASRDAKTLLGASLCLRMGLKPFGSGYKSMTP